MNYWTQLSVDFASQRNYLDELFRVYPTIPEGIRDIDLQLWSKVENAFQKNNNLDLLQTLLKFDLFPIKDSYVAYLKRDATSIARNPETVNRLCGRLYGMGLSKIQEKCTEPKETNRQIGPLFKNWLNSGALGIQPVSMHQFLSSNNNAILNATDAEMMSFANANLGYNRDKGLDFVARFNGKFVIGEAKFLTDFGGHQNAQFADAISTISAITKPDVIKIAILDGVLYIPNKGKMYNYISSNNYNIMSSLVLNEFLYSV